MPTRFAIVGVGWRAEFYLRVAEAMPQALQIVGAVVRDATKGEAIQSKWGVATFRNLDDLLSQCSPDFVVTCVPWSVSPELSVELVDRGLHVLSETPPAPDLPGLRSLWDRVGSSGMVQVAEQYIYQPLHAARLAIAHSGQLGDITQAQVSVCHGYHGVSLIRHYLGIDMAPVAIRARTFESSLVAGPDRQGPPSSEATRRSQQTLAWLDYGDRLGVYDFCDDQYFSWVRAQRVMLRGSRGEIVDKRVRYLKRFDCPLTVDLHRSAAGANGNLEGLYLQAITAGEEWLYENPTQPARLTDEEIAIATVLLRMAERSQGGPDVYSLAQASQDHYLALLIGEASESGQTVESEPQPWMD